MLKQTQTHLEKYAWAWKIIVPTLIYFLVLSLPLPRQIGLSFRYGFSSLVAVLLILLLFPSFIRSKIGTTLTAMVILVIFALPLSGLWMSASSEPGIVSGLLPLSDASGYYKDALRFLSGGKFLSLATRRPLFPVLLSSLLFLTRNNLQLALAGLTLLVAWGTVIASKEVSKTEGRYAAALFTILIFLYYRRFIGLTMTEHLGILLGLLALTIIFRGHSSNNPPLVLMGIVLLSLGLNARAGTMFLLPFLVLWCGYRFRAKACYSWKWTGIATLAAISGFALNGILFYFLAVEDTALFSNFSYTFYGLVQGGKSWTQIFRDHPEVRLLDPAERSTTIYLLAFNTIRDNPSLLLEGIMRSWRQFLNFSSYGGLFGFVSGGDVYIYAENLGGFEFLYIVGRTITTALFLIGLVYTLVRRKQDRLLILAILIGILVSVPFVPPWDADRMRVYAVTIPFLAYFPTLGIRYLTEKFRVPGSQIVLPPVSKNKAETAFIMGIVASFLLFPVLIRAVTSKPSMATIPCPAGMLPMSIEIKHGAYLYVSEEIPHSKTKIPSVSHDRFVRSVHDLPDHRVTSFLNQLPSQQVITSTIDFNTTEYYWLLIDPVKFNDEQIAGRYVVCAESLMASGLSIDPVRVQQIIRINHK